MRDGGFRGGGIREGEIGDGHCRGRVLRDFSLFKPNLINMNVHSATCSCPVELYKLWYILVDFLPNWNFAGFSLWCCMTRQALAHILTINVPLFKN